MSPRRCAWLGVLALTLGKSAQAQPTVLVRGESHCPSADMIRAALDEICPDAEWPFHSVIVDVSAERLSVTLDEDNARRDIPATADCHERAASIALVVRAWSGELPARPTSPPSLSPAPPAPLPAPTKTHAFELDGELFYSTLWGHAPGAWLGAGRTPRAGGLGFRAFAAYQSAQDMALAGGQNRVRRLLTGLGPTLHLGRELLFASAEAGILATFTRAQGDGYASNESAHTWNLGALAQGRAGLQLEPIHLWLSLRVLRLLHEETITVASSPEAVDTSRLQAWDLQLGLGIGILFE